MLIRGPLPLVAEVIFLVAIPTLDTALGLHAHGRIEHLMKVRVGGSGLGSHRAPPHRDRIEIASSTSSASARCVLRCARNARCT